MSHITFPTVYQSTLVINPSTPGCERRRLNSEFQCDYTVILGNNMTIPSPPDLNSEDYVGHFKSLEKRLKPTLC